MADTVLRRFAARLHNLRAERGMTQEALARSAKLHPAYISALERGTKNPSLTTLEQLAKGLKVELMALADFPDTATKAEDKRNDEIELVSRRLKKCELDVVKKIRRAVEVLTET